MSFPGLCSLLALFAVFSLHAEAAKETCPVLNCGAGGNTDPGAEGRPVYESQTPCDEEFQNYSVIFTPGHFTCMKCDAYACPECSLLCDLSSCVGQFYTKECWCSTGADKTGKPTVVFCGDNCEGGVCDTDGMQCQDRLKACQPWWACGAPPPQSFLQTARSTELQHSSTQQGQAMSLNRRLQSFRAEAQAKSHAAAAAAATAGAEAKSHAATASTTQTRFPEVVHFSAGRFDCQSGALPPKTRDPKTLLWVERGYIVLDRIACQGTSYDNKCYCWDEFQRVTGKDPMTSELKCDPGCKWGGCEGKTCSTSPPQPLGPPPPAQPLPQQIRIENTMPVVMEAVDSPGFKTEISR